MDSRFLHHSTTLTVPQIAPKILLAAMLSVGSFILFDSPYVEGLLVPYPIFHYILWVGCLFLLTLAAGCPKTIPHSQALIMFFLLILTGLGITTTLYWANPYILSVGSKALTIGLSLFSMWVGYHLMYKRKLFFRFAISFSAIALIAIPLASVSENFNQNWLALTLGYTALLVILAVRPSIGVVAGISMTVMFVGFWFFASRGVALSFLALALASILVLTIKKFNLKFLHFFYRACSYIVFLSSILIPSISVYISKIDFYHQLNSWSVAQTGKSLSSNRLERWSAAYDLWEKSPFFGYGIDAALPNVSGFEGGSALHNFWLEVFFRFGLIGVIIYVIVFSFLIHKWLRKGCDFYVLIVVLVFFVQMSVYGIGGFTHWPGTFGYWFLFGILLAGTGSTKGLSPLNAPTGK